jgi:hypothetical protein
MIMIILAVIAISEEFIGRIDFDRDQFVKALEGQHRFYDPKERMVYRPYSSAGYHYHTAYKGNIVHPTRESLSYAVACLDSGEPELLQRGIDILERVIALQDTDRNSRTFGIWSWYLEEPLDEMDAPDFNWADFCGVQLLQVSLRHMDRIPQDLAQRVRQAILNACYSIRRRNVGPGYTNIALMGTYVTLVAGQLFDEKDLFDYGRKRLDNFHRYTFYHGSFTEFNSPTYTMVSLRELGRMLRDVEDEGCRRKIAELYRLIWKHIGRHFHEPTRQWAGPHSRAYRNLEGRDFWYFIQRATDHQVQFLPKDEIPFDIGYALLPLKCPRESIHYFKPLREPRQEIEVFFKGREALPDTGEGGDLPLVGTTYLHPKFALGTMNRGDFWNQRRPLILHCGSWDKPTYARLRCLHDGYDYTSGMFFCVQWKGRALIGVNFATNYGDKHPSLDKVKDETIQAEDLRLRLELGGDLSSLQLPEDWKSDEPIVVRIGDLTIRMKVGFAKFDDFRIGYEVGRGENEAWVDVVIYHGRRRPINFGELDCAAFGIALEVKGEGDEDERDSFGDLGVTVERDRLVQRWSSDGKKLMLSIPVKPDKMGALQRQVIASIDP